MGLLEIRVSGVLLRDLLHLDSSENGSVDIVNARIGDGYDNVVLTLQNDKFPPTRDDGSVVIGYPVIRRESDKVIDWGIK